MEESVGRSWLRRPQPRTEKGLVRGTRRRNPRGSQKLSNKGNAREHGRDLRSGRGTYSAKEVLPSYSGYNRTNQERTLIPTRGGRSSSRRLIPVSAATKHMGDMGTFNDLKNSKFPGGLGGGA